MPTLLRYEGSGRAGISGSAVRRRADRMLRALGLSERELSVLLCDDVVMRRLQRRHRGLGRTTDVLSFAMSEGVSAPAGRLLGDVVISVPTARRQARARHRTALEATTELLAHGLLHLLGFDHQTPAELRRMRARTDLLCAAADPSRSRKQRKSRR